MVIDLRLALLVLVLTLVITGMAAVKADRTWCAHRLAVVVRGGPLGEMNSVDQAPFGLVLVEIPTAAAFMWANAEARRLLGLDAASGRLPAAPWTKSLQADVALAERSPSVPQRTTKIDGEQYVKWWIVLGRNQRAVVFLLDVSQQQRVDRSSGRFLETLSHELRTPLTAIVAHVTLLDDLALLDEIQRRSVDFIRSEAQRMARLVTNLLELTRLGATSELMLRPLDPLVVAEEAVAAVILAAEQRQIDIQVCARSPQPWVLADADRLKQVLLNLLDNAIKYSRLGDSIEVTLEPANSSLTCSVRDSGPGIPAEQLPLVRQRMYRARTDVEGSGLGLSLVDEILRLHGTRLELDSSTDPPHSGTTARFQLELAPMMVATPRTIGREAEVAP